MRWIRYNRLTWRSSARSLGSHCVDFNLLRGTNTDIRGSTLTCNRRRGQPIRESFGKFASLRLHFFRERKHRFILDLPPTQQHAIERMSSSRRNRQRRQFDSCLNADVRFQSVTICPDHGVHTPYSISVLRANAEFMVADPSIWVSIKL